MVEVERACPELELPPGFYRLRHVGPETASAETSVALAAGETEERVQLTAAEPSKATLELLEEMGGTTGPGNTIELPGREPVAWATPSTLATLALGSALSGDKGKAALGLDPLADIADTDCRSGIELLFVSGAASST